MRTVRHVVRSLLHRPWYTAPIVAVIAIGYALLTTIFAVVDGVLFKPLGYPAESRLMSIQGSSSKSRFSPSPRPEDLAAWAQSAPGVRFTGFRVHTVASTPSIARAVVQPSFFDVIGVMPALGGFAPEDFEQPDSRIEPCIITDEVFRAQFGSDPNAIGRVVIQDPSIGAGYRIVGVMPNGFVFPAYRLSVGYLTPYTGGAGSGLTYVVARLPPDATAVQVQQRLLAAASAWNSDRSAETSSVTVPIDRVVVEPLSWALGATSRPLFAALLVAAGFLVAVAALNVSSLMAARAIDRGRELDVRRALGASAFDIGRLLLLEAGLLVTAGTVLGLMIAVPLLRFTATLLPIELALFRAPVVDLRVVVFAAIVAVALGTLVAIWPLRLSRAGQASLGAVRTVTFQIRPWSQRLVVVFQIALALMLTVGGSLLVGSLLSVYAQTPPVSTRNTLTVSVDFLGQESGSGRVAPQRVARVNALVDGLRAVPGVESVAVSAYDLLDHAYGPSWFKAPSTAVKPRQAMLTQAATADFYRIVQPELVTGRFPTASELAADEPLVVVSQDVATNYWPNASPIGQTLTDQGRNEPARMFTVVGVVKDVRWHAWDVAPMPMIYGPYALLARQASSAVVIRTLGDSAIVAAGVFRAIAEIDPFARTGRVAPLEELFVDSVRPRRFQAWLFGSFAAASLVVVVIGIFGQLTMSTARRTREVGIRMACGATRVGVIRLIIREQLIPVVVGLVFGGLGAAWSVRFLRSYLYQVTAFDARVWALAFGLTLATAMCGIVIPALRASGTDPTEALRAE